MLFEIKNVTVSEVRDVTSGTSRSGNNWTKATVIVEQRDGNYINTFPLRVFGDRIASVQDLVGKAADIKFSIQGREYNNRWFADLRLSFIAPAGATERREQAPAPAPAPAPKKEDNPDEDLPF